jgi:hypothetical protein
MSCQSCGSDKWVGELVDGKAVKVCADCGAMEPPEPVSVPARKRGRPPLTDSSVPIDVISATKKRLAWLKREVKLLARYNTEIDMLTRLLSAAKDS